MVNTKSGEHDFSVSSVAGRPLTYHILYTVKLVLCSFVTRFLPFSLVSRDSVRMPRTLDIQFFFFFLKILRNTFLKEILLFLFIYFFYKEQVIIWIYCHNVIINNKHNHFNPFHYCWFLLYPAYLHLKVFTCCFFFPNQNFSLTLRVSIK